MVVHQAVFQAADPLVIRPDGLFSTIITIAASVTITFVQTQRSFLSRASFMGQKLACKHYVEKLSKDAITDTRSDAWTVSE